MGQHHAHHEAPAKPALLLERHSPELGGPGVHQVRFRVTSPDRRPVLAFDRVHDKDMHLIIVATISRTSDMSIRSWATRAGGRRQSIFPSRDRTGLLQTSPRPETR